MSHSGVPGASLLSSNPKFNPLGTVGTFLPQAAAVAAPFALGPEVGLPISTAIMLSKGGFDISQGRPLAGALDIAGAGLTGAGALGFGPAAPAAAGAGPAGATGAAAATAPGTDIAATPLFAPTAPSDFATQIGAATNAPVVAGDIGAISPEAGFGGAGATGIPAATSPDLLTRIGQGVGVLPPGQGINPVGAGGFGTVTPPTPTGATAGGATAAGEPSTSLGRFIKNPSLAGAGDVLAANPGVALGALGLGYEATKGNPPIPNLSNLESQAAALAQEGAALRAPLTGAPLPTGAQSAIDQGVESAKAAIRSHFASAGLSGSSMEASALAQADEQGVMQRFQIAQTMAQQGADLTKIDLSTYQSIMDSIIKQDTQLQNAVANFAGAMAGGAMRAA